MSCNAEITKSGKMRYCGSIHSIVSKFLICCFKYLIALDILDTFRNKPGVKEAMNITSVTLLDLEAKAKIKIDLVS
jgi:hypothetical protein